MHQIRFQRSPDLQLDLRGLLLTEGRVGRTGGTGERRGEEGAFSSSKFATTPLDIRRITKQPSLSSTFNLVVSLSLGILHEWMRTQAIFELPADKWSNHRGGRALLGWRTCPLDVGIHEIWRKFGLSGYKCLHLFAKTLQRTAVFCTSLFPFSTDSTITSPLLCHTAYLSVSWLELLIAINTTNCSISIVLTATDQKAQK